MCKPEDQCDKDKETCTNGIEKSCGCAISRDKSKYSENIHNENVDKNDDPHFEPSHAGHAGPRTNEMVFVGGGNFHMGTNKPVFIADGEGPERQVKVNSFYLDKYEVSNKEFEIFVAETKYKTEVHI